VLPGAELQLDLSFDSRQEANCGTSLGLIPKRTQLEPRCQIECGLINTRNGEQEMTDVEIVAESPCLGDCNLNDKGICQSCFLSSEENDQWNHVSNQERLVMLQNARERQKAKSGG
jgi:predicted Fe-S protein YdhL (DUF1289 family)